MFPVSRSTHTANNCLPSSVAVVSQICRPQITGDDQPRSWIGVFHLTWFVSLQFNGSPIESEHPSPFGPRN
jgi:hypothetical protein